jgi:molybdopterin molybdotransferase
MISPEEAWGRIEPLLEALGSETVDLEGVAGRVLARPLEAMVDVPACRVSAMDGYALAGGVTPGDERAIAGVIAAGDAPGFELPAGEAARIMTGAPIPAGADTVVPVECSDGGREHVCFTGEIDAGANVREQGEILSAGAPLLSPGHLLTPGAIALLTAHGYPRVEVHRLPRVAILATGDEVVPPEVTPAPGQIRDTNTAFLDAAVRAVGPVPRSLGIAPDRPEAIAAKVAQGLGADVFLICGGVSMGEYDYVDRALDEAGCDKLFERVALQPGKPLVAARHPGGWVFGLPGNPASVMVCFWLFVRPLLRSLAGRPDGFWSNARVATLDDPLPGAAARDRIFPAELERQGGALRAHPVIPKGSHDVAAFARGTALIRVRAGAPPKSAGEPCEALPIWD